VIAGLSGSDETQRTCGGASRPAPSRQVAAHHSGSAARPIDEDQTLRAGITGAGGGTRRPAARIQGKFTDVARDGFEPGRAPPRPHSTSTSSTVTARALTMAGGLAIHSWYMVTSHMQAKQVPIMAPAPITTQANGL